MSESQSASAYKGHVFEQLSFLLDPDAQRLVLEEEPCSTTAEKVYAVWSALPHRHHREALSRDEAGILERLRKALEDESKGLSAASGMEGFHSLVKEAHEQLAGLGWGPGGTAQVSTETWGTRWSLERAESLRSATMEELYSLGDLESQRKEQTPPEEFELCWDGGLSAKDSPLLGEEALRLIREFTEFWNGALLPGLEEDIEVWIESDGWRSVSLKARQTYLALYELGWRESLVGLKLRMLRP